MKTITTTLILTLALGLNTLTAQQQADRNAMFQQALAAEKFLNEIHALPQSKNFRSEAELLDSTYNYATTDEGILFLNEKLEYAYDASGELNLVRKFTQINSAWVEDLRANLQYEPDSNRVITTIEALDESTQEFKLFARETKRTTATNQPQYHELAMHLDLLGFIPFNTTRFAYHANGKLLAIYTHDFDFEQFKLLPSEREVYHYDDSWIHRSTTVELYDVDLMDFNLHELREVGSYDQHGNIKNLVTSYFNVVVEEWLPFIEQNFLYAYDSNARITKQTTSTTYIGEQTEILSEEFEYHKLSNELTLYKRAEVVNGILIPLSKSVTTYNQNDQVQTEEQYNYQAQTEVLQSRGVHYYRGGTSASQDDKALPAQIKYRNPAVSGDVVEIHLKENIQADVFLYDLMGKKVGADSFFQQENFRIPALASGTYILVVQADGFMPESRKLVIK